jgi:hypothetical protein
LRIGDETAVYDVMSRTTLEGSPLGDIEKDFLLDLIKGLEEMHSLKRLSEVI